MKIPTPSSATNNSLRQLLGPLLTLGLILVVELLDRHYQLQNVELLLIVATVLAGYVCGRTSALLSALMSCIYITYRAYIDDPIGQPLSTAMALVTIAVCSVLLRRDGENATTTVIERDEALYNAYSEAQKSVEKFTGIVKFAVDAIIVMNNGQQIVVFNRGAERLFGYPSGAVVGQPIEIILPHELATLAADSVARTNDNNPEQNDSGVELRCVHKDGHVFFAEATLHDVATGIERLRVITLRDITLRREKDAAFRKSEQRFHHLIDKSPEGVLVVDGSQIIYANQAYADLSGIAPTALIGTTIETQFEPVGLNDLQRRLHKSTDEDQPVTLELNLLRSDKAVRVEVHAARCRFGDLQAVQVLVHDISIRNREDENLRDSEARFRELAHNIHDIFWITNVDCSEVYYVSPAFEKIWGHSCQSAYSKKFSFADAIHPDDRHRALSFTMEARHGEPRSCEYRIIRPDGSMRWIQDRRFPIKDDEGTVRRITGIVQDITERRLAEEQIRRFNDELEQRNHETVLLNNLSSVLQSCLSLDEAYNAIPQTCHKLFPRFAGSLNIVHSAHSYLESVADWGDPMLTDQIFEPRTCWALRRGQWHRYDSNRPAVLCQHVQASGKQNPVYLCVPLMAQSEVLGLLYLELHDPSETAQTVGITENETRLAVTFADQVAMALANIRLRETLRNQSIRDPVTGLYNRRYFEEALLREMARAERREGALSVIMLDVDNLKRVTEEYGHKAGDKVMNELATTLLAHTRISDSACHYGGGEFVLLLPDTETGSAVTRAEHIRAAITALAIKLEDGPICRVHVSLGIANYPKDGRQPDALIKAADRALYLAKHSRTHPQTFADNNME